MVTPEKEEAFLNEVLLGDKNAVDAAINIGYISQIFDDIIDKDVEHTSKNLCIWLLIATTGLAKNPFYVAHINSIEPILYTAMADYLASTEMEKSGDHEKNLAFVLRNNLIAVVIHFARLVGGYKHGLDVAQKVRSFYHDESLEDYKGGL